MESYKTIIIIKQHKLKVSKATNKSNGNKCHRKQQQLKQGNSTPHEEKTQESKESRRNARKSKRFTFVAISVRLP